MQDTIVPVVAGTIMTVIFIPLNWLLMKPLSHGGLALATSITAIMNMILLLELLRRRLKGINGGLIIKSFTKVLIASGVSGLVAWFALGVISAKFPVTGTAHAIIAVIGASVPAVLAYAGMIALLKVDEATEVWKLVSRRFKRSTMNASG